MSFSEIAILFSVALVAGALNAVAGGGSFFTFPTMIVMGIPPIPANATNTIALWPGSLASIMAYKRELALVQRILLIILIITSTIGGIGGAMLLLVTPPDMFMSILPYLLLVATLLFALSGTITKRLRMRKVEGTKLGAASLIGISIAQMIISIYGGYFGGGIGILMLATLALMGIDNVHVMNGLKVVLATCINGVAVITFVIAQAVLWPQAIVMIIAAIIGGYGGAAFARRLKQEHVRLFVVIVGTIMTLYFFINPS